MKKLILLLPLLYICAITDAQIITAGEMLAKTDCKTTDCFSSFIEEKGFKYSRMQNYPGNQKMLIYTAEDADSQASFMYDSVNKMVMISITTTDAGTSKELIDQFIAKGFSKVYSESLPDKSIVTTYESRKLKRMSLTLRTKTAPQNGADVTTHYFTIQKG